MNTAVGNSSETKVNFESLMNINNIKGCGTAIDDDEEEEAVSLNHLPDEILLLIFNRLSDLKTLCHCSLVSPRFSSLIFHVHSVSFNVLTLPHPPTPELHNLSLRSFVFGILARPLHIVRQISNSKPPHPTISSFYDDSFRSALYFLTKFKSIRSLTIVLPPSSHQGINDSNSIFKWTAKFGPTIETFIFHSHTSIRRGGESEFEERQGEGEGESHLTNESLKRRLHLAFQCLKDAILRHRMLLFFIGEHLMLQNITITDSNKQGTLFLKGTKLVETRNLCIANSEPKRNEVPVVVKQWHVPVLKLPVLRRVMEGAMLVLIEMVSSNDNGDGATLVDAFEQGEEEEEAFAEAVVETVVNHESRINILI